MRIPEARGIGNLQTWQDAVATTSASADATPPSKLASAIAELETLRAALAAETRADRAAAPSMLGALFSGPEGNAARREANADRQMLAAVDAQIAKLQRVTGALPKLKFDPTAPDAQRLATITALPSVLWPAGWEALAHIAAADPSAEVRAAAKAHEPAKRQSISSSNIYSNPFNPMNPMSQFGPGPSFYRR